MNLRDENEIISSWDSSTSITVSISCITYNHENYIESAIKSFLSQQTTFSFEILIHDDASSDNTVNIIKKYEKLYPNLISPIYQKENQYLKNIKANVINFKRAKGKYIAFCDGDDYWHSEFKLKTQIEYMEKYPQCDVSFHGVRIEYQDRNLIEDRLSDSKQLIYSLSQIIAKDHKLVFSSSSIMIKTNIVKNLPKFYALVPVEDYYLRILGAERGGGIYIPQILSTYRRFIPNSFTVINRRSPKIALKNFHALNQVRIYLKRSIFSTIGIKVILFYVKYLIFLIMNFYYLNFKIKILKN